MKKYPIWRIKNKSDPSGAPYYDIGVTTNRLAIYERSDYFDSSADYTFASILREDYPDLAYAFDHVKGVSNVIRMSSLVNCLRQTKHLLCKGYSVVECGAGPQQSTRYITKYLNYLGFKGVYQVYDTFEGHADQTEFVSQSEFVFDYQSFLDTYSHLPYMEVYKGYVPESFVSLPENICFVNLDMNIFTPTLAALEQLWPRISHNGIVHVDDYNIKAWPGVTKAVKLFISTLDHSDFFLFEHPTGGCFIIKLDV